MNKLKVFDKINVTLDRTRILETLKVPEKSSYHQSLLEMIGSVESMGKPSSMVLPVNPEVVDDDTVRINGWLFQSRILVKNIVDSKSNFAVVTTAGQELENWRGTINDMLYSFWADNLLGELLFGAVAFTNHWIGETYALDHVSWMTPGSLPNWPISEQKNLFALLGSDIDRIGVSLSETLVMYPPKTVSGIVFSSDTPFYSCQLCAKEGCEKRRAEFDINLAKTKFGIEASAE